MHSAAVYSLPDCRVHLVVDNAVTPQETGYMILTVGSYRVRPEKDQQPKLSQAIPIVDDSQRLAHHCSCVSSMQSGREQIPELAPGQFLMRPCCPAPEEPHAGVADDLVRTSHLTCMVFLYH